MKKRSIFAILLCVIMLLSTSCSDKNKEVEQNKENTKVTTSTNVTTSNVTTTKQNETTKKKMVTPSTTKYKINLKDKTKMNVRGISFYIPKYGFSKDVKHEDTKKSAKYYGKLYEFKGKDLIGGYAVYSTDSQQSIENTSFVSDFDDALQFRDEWMVEHILYEHLSWDRKGQVDETTYKRETFKNFKSKYNGLALRHSAYMYTSSFMEDVDDYEEYMYYYSEIFPFNDKELLILWVADLTKDNSLTPECKKILIDYYLKDYLRKISPNSRYFNAEIQGSESLTLCV